MAFFSSVGGTRSYSKALLFAPYRRRLILSLRCQNVVLVAGRAFPAFLCRSCSSYVSFCFERTSRHHANMTLKARKCVLCDDITHVTPNQELVDAAAAHLTKPYPPPMTSAAVQKITNNTPMICVTHSPEHRDRCFRCNALCMGGNNC